MRQNFHIFVDADACPVVAEIERIASKYSLPVTLLYDTNHILTSEYCETIMVSAGRDSVDLALINRTKRGDVVVTQDFGVAALALGKGAFVMHQNGWQYTNDNIDELLADRHWGKKMRSSARNRYRSQHKKKRTSRDNKKFAAAFEVLIVKRLEETESPVN